MAHPSPNPREAVAPELLTRVDAARQSWIRQLVDMSRRNNLLYFRDLKVGTLDLSNAPTEAMQALLQSGGNGRHSVRLTDLVDEARRTQANAAVSEIWKRAISNYEERGLDTLFLALGLATWTARDGGRNLAAPVLLVPLEASQSGGRSGPWSLRRSGDVKVNDVLVHALREEHGVTLDPESLVPEVLGDDEGEVFDLEPVFNAISANTKHVPGFDIDHRWILGNFAFQKMAIVNDLKNLLDALARHDLVAAIAGDADARVRARGDRASVDPADFDQQRPEEEFLIRDADSSQQQAITATLRGQNGVISGPPGTGKSQTIANLIAELVARGKSVLFVAEKRAALDVVLHRLKEADLSHLCLDCHGAELSRRHIAEQFKESLDRIREAPIPDPSELHKRFVERRDRLNAHVEAMHGTRQPGGLTVYELYCRLLGLPEAAACQARLPKQELFRLDQTALEEACERMRELASLAGLFTGTALSPWIGASLTTADQVRLAVERVRRLATERWRRFESVLAALLGECPAKEPQTVAEAHRLVEVLSAIEDSLKVAEEGLFQQEMSSLARQLEPARSTLRAIWATIFDGRFRAARRRVRELCTGEAPSSRESLALVKRAQRQLHDWREIAVDERVVPTRQPRVADLAEAWGSVVKELEPLMRVFSGRSLNDLTLESLTPWLHGLAKDVTSPAQILKIHEVCETLKAQGLEPVLQEVLATKPESAFWPDMLRHAWLASCLDEIQFQDPSVPGFDGRLHDDMVKEFQQLDQERLRVAIQRVQHAHARKAIEIRNRHSLQDSLVSKEAHKRSRHLPLRRLFAQAPDVLVGFRPCWMASPLSVSQLIPGEKPIFDVVIFDEASQVLPEDAITSLLRGGQAVVAGDQRQLPPTTFFAARDPGEDDDEQNEATVGFQSILDVMSAFLDPPWTLNWHYRSRNEALIAYSNHRIYGGSLVTFPGPGGPAAVRHELVASNVTTDAQELSVAAEVQQVVELVREHVQERPDESLGVITMGIEHARRIEMALDRARQEDATLELLFVQGKSERFFVKNLERVQGDERDAIILSIGYGKNDAGQLVYRFGPLLQEGGERRLNVAITRARQRMTVVSSFTHHDMRADYPKLGVKLLRGFLEFAASGGTSFGQGEATEVSLNYFEQSVFDELTRRGLKLIGQVGSSSYRIDMAAMHPEQHGRYVLAIECDGASYHSAHTARDRDRLRQQQLEARGWRFHRIWSTDWFLRREDEVQRTLAAFDEAMRVSDERTPHPEPPQPRSSERENYVRTRTPRPAVARGKSIEKYSRKELEAMVRWVLSDGGFYTDDEVVSHVAVGLGKRRGSRVVDAIKSAIRAVRVSE